MAWGSAITPTAVARRRSVRSVFPRPASASAIALMVASNSATSRASASMRIVRVPSWVSSSTQTPRPSRAALARRAACSGSNLASATVTRSRTRFRPILCAKPTTWSSTQAAASAGRVLVCSAIFRARQAGRVPAAHPGPEPGQPVPQLERVADQAGPGERRHGQRGGELGGRELGDLRGALAGQPDQPLRPGHRDPGGVGAGQHRVQVGPVRGQREQLGLRAVRGPAPASSPRPAPPAGPGHPFLRTCVRV